MEDRAASGKPRKSTQRQMYSILPLTYRMQFTGFGSAIRVLLHGNVRFEPEDIENLTSAFELALNKFELADRQDPLTVVLAKLIIELARDGERDPAKLCKPNTADRARFQ